MSYDLNETYIDTRKTQITTLEADIAELESLKDLFRKEEKFFRRAISNRIETAINIKRDEIKVLYGELMTHYRTTIGV